MGTFKGFHEEGTPKFMRSRKAAQYAASTYGAGRVLRPAVLSLL
jgi:hypothetical protein